jgi:molecular chaperone GrpE
MGTKMADTKSDPSVDPAATSEASENAAPAGEPAPAADPPSEAIDPTDHARVAAEYKDKLLRVLAEMENLRRRTEREIADTRAYGISAFARDILAVADNMDRALQALDAEIRERADASVKALLDGVELTERELHKVLEKNGVKKFDPLGEKFDPNLHQAMFEIQDPSRPAGTVAQVMQPGYKIGERVLRPALVAVAKGGPKPAAEPPANDNLGDPSEDLQTQKDPQHSA